MTTTDSKAILEVRDLRTHLFTRKGVGKAVDGVSFSLFRGKTLGLVGESGSGKSMTAVSLLRLHPAPAARIISGEVIFDGVDLLQKSDREMRHYRGRDLAYVPQDPLSALNPVFRIGEQLGEALTVHRGLGGKVLREKLIGLLRKVNVPEPEQRLSTYPHQLSGGMRQRVVSAIGISCDPKVLIADEPTTSLDVTVQAVYLDLLREIQAETGLAILFITHDFGIVANLCDEVAVMYAGRIVERASTQQLFETPLHPYSRALISTLPDPSVKHRRLPAIVGHPPSIFERPPGCPFAPRCTAATATCLENDPPFLEMGDNRGVACWNAVQ